MAQTETVYAHLAALWLLLCLCIEYTIADYCDPGHGFPEFCPGPNDPPDHTKCCKNYYNPSCCQERANHVCVKTATGKRSGTSVVPDFSEQAIYCPGPDDPDSYGCCYGKNGKMHCCDISLILGLVFGIVFGTLAVVGTIIGIVCCYKVKKGDWICVQIRPGKYTMVTRKKMERIQEQQQQRQQQMQQQSQFQAQYTNQGFNETPIAPPPYSEKI